MLSASADTVDISPSVPCVMGCGPSRDPILEVRDRLEANLVVFSDGSAKVLLVTLDCLYAGQQVRAVIERELSGLLTPEAIFVAASHTHYAPSLDRGKPALGLPEEGHLHHVGKQIAATARRLLDDHGASVRLEVERFASNAAVNRRLPRLLGVGRRGIKWRPVVIAPNFATARDYVGHVIRVLADDGSPVCVITQLPCHPVSLPTTSLHSAHFPGFLRMKFRELYGSDIPVLFLQGFSGDLRPASVAKPHGATQWARRIVMGPGFTNFDEEGYARWLQEMWQDVLSARQVDLPQPDSPLVGFCRVENDLSHVAVPVAGKAGHVSAHRVSLGSLDLIGISAEPVAAWAERLERGSGERVRVPVGCIDDTFGYAPTGAMMREGGYEGADFCRFFELNSLRPDFSIRIAAMLEQVTRIPA